jgi:hypothetical protein
MHPDVETLRDKYAPKLEAIQNQIRLANERLEREQAEASWDATIALGSSIFGALAGQKAKINVSRAAKAARAAARANRVSQHSEAARSLESLRQKYNELDTKFQIEMTKLSANLGVVTTPVVTTPVVTTPVVTTPVLTSIGTIQAKQKLDDARIQHMQITKKEACFVINYALTEKIRAICDKAVPRAGALILFMLIPLAITLIIGNSIGTYLILIPVALVAGVLGSLIFLFPSDFTINSWKHEYKLIQDQKQAMTVIYDNACATYQNLVQRDKAEATRVEAKNAAEAARVAARIAAEAARVAADVRLTALRSTHWKSLQGIPFEIFLGDIFRQWGFKVETTKASGDQGVDLIISRNNMRIAIQAKGYSSAVGNSAVQEVYAGMKHYNCQKCVVITNSTFTSGARSLATSVGCLLLDEQSIVGLINGQFSVLFV